MNVGSTRIVGRGLLGVLLGLMFVVGLPGSAAACSACYGNPDSALTQGAQFGVLTMLIFTYAALMGFGAMFTIVVVRARKRLSQSASPA